MTDVKTIRKEIALALKGIKQAGQRTAVQRKGQSSHEKPSSERNQEINHQEG
jgi:hypothetical protein